MKPLSASLLLALLAAVAYPQDKGVSGPTKDWKFQMEHGEASIKVEHGPNDQLILGILGPPCRPCASLEEMARAIEQVVRQMPSAGLDPKKISYIVTGINEPEVRERVAMAALRSKDWLSCVRVVGCAGNESLVNLLNETGAYLRFGDSFTRYGETLHVESAEKITVIRASGIKGLAIPAGTKGRIRVPVDGTLLIRLESAPVHL